MAPSTSTTHSILIVNPNTSQHMTEGLKPLVKSLNYGTTAFTYFTAPSGVPSINSESDAAISASACLPALQAKLPDHDAFLICCYSAHPLVPQLRSAIREAGFRGKLVTGIFEASIATCLQSIDLAADFGIVSTGAQWEDILGSAVSDLLGGQGSERYAGTETTGLDADELHSTPKDEVDRRLKEATKRLLSIGNGNVQAICLGCAGMAGMAEVVREACVEARGQEAGGSIKIVDGVVSGIAFLEGALRSVV